MKQIVKTGLLTTVFACALSLLQAQIYVTVRPTRPTVVVTRPAAPAAGYIWVDDEWVPQGKTYVYKAGAWVAPPRSGAVYNKGYWKRNKKGWHWVPGRWK
ncbi:YXWGXW repeat-containing protein [Sediminibacterium soli]|uniref:YXWGXW repeat-containing protein n=1 Tax=Sediminibacterium soli TaxID=2698829 RepID=UPI00137970CB|nr:YXWGXW repeat-containing protein [Sediminibacterium soli]NCI46462.1 BcpO-related WXXGXW repeat protein [Sediminibacterium soli]